ncbi:hypothetical protein Tco_0708525 [Tanacetum coccineum]
MVYCHDKKIIITESTVRRDLQLEDAKGVECLPNSTIFEQLTLIGSKNTAWNEFSSTMASIPQSSDPSDNVADEAVHKELGDSLVRAATTASSLEAEQDSGNITKTRSKATPNESSSLGTTSGGGPRCQETMGDTIAQTRFENVLDLEKTKTTQANEIASLKRRVKKLEKKNSMEGYKLNDLKLKEFDSIQEMFDRAFKRQKVEDDKETAEIKKLMEIIPDEEEVTIDAIPLDVNFDSEDLETLYKLVKAKYESTRPVEDLDLVLWNDLKTMFEPHVEDRIWRNQQDYKVLSWKLYDSRGVHFLRMQHMQIYMLVEKKYPLTPSKLTMMLEKKLMIDYESEMAY